MAKNLTKKQAEAALKKVEKWMEPWTKGAGDKPKLYPPGFHTTGWSIAYEGGPWDWTYLIGGGVEEEFGFKMPPITFGKHVFAEPVNNCILGLYYEG